MDIQTKQGRIEELNKIINDEDNSLKIIKEAKQERLLLQQEIQMIIQVRLELAREKQVIEEQRKQTEKENRIRQLCENKAIICDACGKHIKFENEVWHHSGHRMKYCSPSCFASYYGDCNILTPKMVDIDEESDVDSLIDYDPNETGSKLVLFATEEEE